MTKTALGNENGGFLTGSSWFERDYYFFKKSDSLIIDSTKIGKEGNIPRPSVFYIEKVLREELLIAELSELIKAGSCDLAAFQTISQKVHHPKKRLKETSLWLKENHTFCSTPDLIRLSNRLPELMGTADTKGELKQQIHHAILEKSVFIENIDSP